MKTFFFIKHISLNAGNIYKFAPTLYMLQKFKINAYFVSLILFLGVRYTMNVKNMDMLLEKLLVMQKKLEATINFQDHLQMASRKNGPSKKP